MILEQQGHQSSGQTTQAIPPAQSTDPLLVLLFKELASLLLGSEQEQSFLFLFSHAAAQI